MTPKANSFRDRCRECAASPESETCRKRLLAVSSAALASCGRKELKPPPTLCRRKPRLVPYTVSRKTTSSLSRSGSPLASQIGKWGICAAGGVR